MISENGNQEIKDLIDHLQTHLYQPIHSQEVLIKNLKELVFEDKEVLEYFSSKIFATLQKKSPDINQVFQLFEAWVYEHRLRVKEKVKKLTSLETSSQRIKANMTNSENLSKRLQKEIHLYKQLNEIKIKRQFGSLKQSKFELKKDTDVYDWVVDIDMLTSVNKHGWKIKFSDHFLKNSSETIKNHIMGSKDSICTLSKSSKEKAQLTPIKNGEFENMMSPHKVSPGNNKSMNYFYDQTRNQANSPNKGTWEGAIVSVVGLYDKGKTFVLNNLSESNLPSGKKVTTAGLSFKYVDIEKGTKLILLDTAGSYSPVKITNECSIIEKEATEMFILDLVFDVSDYFIFVVNDFTSLDQRYLDKLTRSLQSSADKSFREVIGRVHKYSV